MFWLWEKAFATHCLHPSHPCVGFWKYSGNECPLFNLAVSFLIRITNASKDSVIWRNFDVAVTRFMMLFWHCYIISAMEERSETIWYSYL